MIDKPAPATRRLRIGRLADGREAFAVQAYTPTPTGNRCHSVTVWVRNRRVYGGCKVLRDVSFTNPHSKAYQEAFALIVEGREKRIRRNFPIRIAASLGWVKLPA
jgi:hypothetical protein